MPNWGITAAENSPREITLENQRISDLQCCKDSKIRYSEERDGMENLFENRRSKAARVRTHLK
jgi:hypothetical protein